MTAPSCGVLATGSYLPGKPVSNLDVADRMDVTAEWIVGKTHITARHYAAPSEATSDLAAEAARRALAQAGLAAADIDYLIVATSTGDHWVPATANLVQTAIGAENAACFDINVACSGFVYALALSEALLISRPGKYVLVTGADLYSRILDYTDPKVSALGGDGAGAAIVGPARGSGEIIGFKLASRGDHNKLIKIHAGGSRLPASKETVQNGGHHLRMQGRAVRDFVLEHVPPALAALAHEAGVELDQIDHFVPHQPNGVLINQLADEAGLGKAMTHRTIDRCGNMGSASVPVTLDQANRSGELRDGALVLLAGFGGGMNLGACLLRWGV